MPINKQVPYLDGSQFPPTNHICGLWHMAFVVTVGNWLQILQMCRGESVTHLHHLLQEHISLDSPVKVRNIPIIEDLFPVNYPSAHPA